MVSWKQIILHKNTTAWENSSKRKEIKMTIKEFAFENHTTIETVKGWVCKGLIPGAHDDYVPNSARRPYNARAKKGYSLLKSMMKACSKGEGITPATYHLTAEHFRACVDYLISEGLIFSHIEDDITYYDLTTKGHDNLRIFKPSNWISLATACVSVLPFLSQIISL